MVVKDGVRDIFEECCLAGFGWADDEASLAATDWAEEVDVSARGGAAGVFQLEPWLRVDGSELFELWAGRRGWLFLLAVVVLAVILLVALVLVVVSRFAAASASASSAFFSW